jgi:DMSO/TMAO reductase YedYZ heme-binding membrane subunit
MQVRRGDPIRGWRLVGALSAVIAAATLLFAARDGFDEQGLRMALHFTARTSLILFLLVFSASSLRKLWPGAQTQWLLRNRRYLGLSFAASHAMHAAAIVAFALAAPLAFREATSAATFVFGGIGYAFIVALAATSFDRTAAAIGPRAWRVLHKTGAFYLWAQFTVSFAKHHDGTAVYWLFLGLLGAAMALRVAAWLSPRPQAARVG